MRAVILLILLSQAATAQEKAQAPPVPDFLGTCGEPRKLERDGVPVRAAAAHPKAPLFLAARGDRVLVVGTGEGIEARAFDPGAGTIEALALDRDGRRLLVAGGIPGKEGRAILVDLETGVCIPTERARGDSFPACALSPLATRSAAGTVDGRILVSSPSDPMLRTVLAPHRDWVLALAYAPDGNWLASGDREGATALFEAATGVEIRRSRARSNPAVALTFSPDARWMAFGDGRQVRFERAAEEPGDRAIDSRLARVNALAWIDGTRLLAGGDGDGIALVDLRQNAARRVLACGTEVTALAWHAEAGRLLVGDLEGGITITEVGSRSSGRREGAR